MQFQKIIQHTPFNKWLFQNKENKRFIFLAIAVIIISFVYFKCTYPYLGFISPDSYGYIDAANNNDFINIWPIGYSKFLRLSSFLTSSYLALTIFQYILLQASILYLLFTIRYLGFPGNWLFRILFILSIANPLLPYIASLVSSEALFTSISIIWFTQIWWIKYKCNKVTLTLHAFVILLAIIIQFTAVYYPFVSTIIILSTSISTLQKWLSIGAIAVMVLIFIGRTQYEYKLKTNTIQLYALGGWQMAANVLQSYEYADSISVTKTPYKFRELHRLVNQYNDSLRHLNLKSHIEKSSYYLWEKGSPLVMYINKYWPKTKKEKYFIKWANYAPLYGQYSRWLISERPLSYIKHYVWPNLLKYFDPSVYNMKINTIEPTTINWRTRKNDHLPIQFIKKEIHLMNFFSSLSAILNATFLIIILFFIRFSNFKKSGKIYKQTICSLTFIWIVNALYSLLSAPIEIRTQTFSILMTVTFCFLLLSGIIQSLKIKSINAKQNVLLHIFHF